MLPRMSLRSSAVHRVLQCSSATAILGLTLAACGSTASNSTHAGTTPNPSKTSSQATTKPISATSAGKCASAPAPAPAPKGAQSIPKPKLTLDPVRRYVVGLSTNCGSIEIQLDVHRAPRTTASFAYLVKLGFYDRLTFHRVAAGFVIQGGDPNGDGSGGPGYSVIEPPPSDIRYTLGTVAMAKTGTDPAGASGSQFFIVTAQEAPLPAQYALVGNVVGGLAAVEAIAKVPTDPPQDGEPIKPVVISHATLSAS
jgi:peptidyl-prolyl cis-trans isomerase B (cyclophilin B)